MSSIVLGAPKLHLVDMTTFVRLYVHHFKSKEGSQRWHDKWKFTQLYKYYSVSIKNTDDTDRLYSAGYTAYTRFLFLRCSWANNWIWNLWSFHYASLPPKFAWETRIPHVLEWHITIWVHKCWVRAWVLVCWGKYKNFITWVFKPT